MPESIENELSLAAGILRDAPANSQDLIMWHQLQYNAEAKLRRITIFINDGKDQTTPRAARQVVNSYHANIDLIQENMVGAAVDYLASISASGLSPALKKQYATDFRKIVEKIAGSRHHDLQQGRDPEVIFKAFQEQVKDAIKSYARSTLHMAWNSDHFYKYAIKHRLETEIVVVTHNNKKITHFGYESGTATSAHHKGVAIQPPNSTSYFEYSVDTNGEPTLIDSGHTIASPAPKGSQDAYEIIRQNLIIAAQNYLSTRKSLESPPSVPDEGMPELDDVFASARECKVDPKVVAFSAIKIQIQAERAKFTYDMAGVHVFHILLTTPQVTGKNDGQWTSWKKEKAALDLMESKEEVDVSGSKYPVHLHMICSGINERWSPHPEIHNANIPAIKELIELLKREVGDNLNEARRLIAAIRQFSNPESPYFYMQHGGNALRFNQVLSKACRLTDSIYIVGCKSGNDRTFLQTLFNAAANGSPHPGVMHLSNTVSDTAATPKASCSKFAKACNFGLFMSSEAPPKASCSKSAKAYNSVFFPAVKASPLLPGEIEDQQSLRTAAANYPYYQQLGTAHHKAKRNVLQKAGKTISIHVTGHTKDDSETPSPG